MIDKVLEGLSPKKESTTISDEMLVEEAKKQHILALYHEMNIPLLYRDKTLKTFKGFEDEVCVAKRDIIRGMSLFLSGDCGTGKTHMAVGLMCHWYGKTFKPSKGLFDPGVPKFLPAVEFFLELKKNFDGGSESEILDKYSKPKLLVIDDVGAEKISDWSRQIFYTLIDRRYRDMKQTIITSNLSLSEFAEKFDDRIVSRLCENGRTITLKGKDWRLKS